MSDKAIEVINHAARELDISMPFGEVILAALKAAGIEVVELPDATYTHTDSDLSCERGREWETASGPLRAFEDGHVEWDGDRSSVDEFRRTAAAFLAAADAAEAVTA